MSKEKANIDFVFKSNAFMVRITTRNMVEEVSVTAETEAIVLETLTHRAAKNKIRRKLEDIIEVSE